MQRIKLVLWASFVIKLFLALSLPLSQDESYYWVWSKHLQLSYFDHPPMVAWLLWLGNFFEDFHHAVRIPHLVLGHLALWIWALILQPFMDKEKVSAWLFLAIASPLLGIGSFLTTPDVPLLFFWSLATYFALQIFEKHKLADYVFLGIALGLGFLSKYHIVLFVPALLFSLLLHQNYKNVKITGVLLTLIFGLIFSSPVLIWNYQNEFKSFLFQIDHGFGQKKWDPFWTYSYLLGQICIIFPTVFYAFLRAPYQKNRALLFCLAWLPFLFFIFSSFKGPVEPNWPVTGLFAIFALAAIAPVRKIWINLGIIFWGSMSFLFLLQAYTPFFTNAPEKLNELRYFDPVKPVAKQYSPMYFGSYQMASSIWYETKVPQKKLFQINRHDFFDELNPTPPGEKVFYVLKEVWVPFPGWLNDSQFHITKLQNVGEKFELNLIEAK